MKLNHPPLLEDEEIKNEEPKESEGAAYDEGKIIIPSYQMTKKVQIGTPTPHRDIIDVIAELAINPDSNMEKFRAMLDMKKEIDAAAAEKAFAMDFAPMKAELPVVEKKHYNDQTKSHYAKIEDINAAVDPVLGRHGFSSRFRVSQTNDSVTVACIIQHKDGHKEEAVVTLPLDEAGAKGTVNKTKVHAIASSVMYAKRLAKCAALDVSTGEDDDGNAAGGGEVAVTDFMAETLKEVLMDCSEATKEWFMEKYGDVKKVPKDQFTVVLTILQNKRHEAKKAAKTEEAPANANS